MSPITEHLLSLCGIEVYTGEPKGGDSPSKSNIRQKIGQDLRTCQRDGHRRKPVAEIQHQGAPDRSKNHNDTDNAVRCAELLVSFERCLKKARYHGERPC